MLRLIQFRSVMTGATKGIDEQADDMRSVHIQYNRDVLCSITKTVILTGRQNLSLRGHATTQSIMFLLILATFKLC